MDRSREETKVLDMNELVAKRIAALRTAMERPENAGFVPGIVADNVAVDGLLSDSEDDNFGEDGDNSSGFSGNVIKANPAPEAAPQVDTEEIKRQAEEAAQRIIDDERQQAESIMRDAEAKIEEERERIYAEARTRGEEEGRADGYRESDALKAELQQKIAQHEQEYRELLDELEPKMVETISGVYEHVFHIEFSEHRDIIFNIISDALRNVEGKSLLVHISKDDYEYVNSRKEELNALASGVKIDLIEDFTLSEGACLIETDGGILDCGLGTQLEELSKKIKLLAYEN